MSLIKNLIKEVETENTQKSKDGKESSQKNGNLPRQIIKSATDLQRLKVEKLMKNPDKPILIPEPRKEKDYMQTVPSFVRNVMGSSAGAGSGEFHVYRHLRRKEYARQKTIQAKSLQEQLDEDYQRKLDENRRVAEEKTAKKRAKRLKRKQRFISLKHKTVEKEKKNEDSSDDSDSQTNEIASADPQDDNAKKQKLNDNTDNDGIQESNSENENCL